MDGNGDNGGMVGVSAVIIGILVLCLMTGGSWVFYLLRDIRFELVFYLVLVAGGLLLGVLGLYWSVKCIED